LDSDTVQAAKPESCHPGPTDSLLNARLLAPNVGYKAQAEAGPFAAARGKPWAGGLAGSMKNSGGLNEGFTRSTGSPLTVSSMTTRKDEQTEYTLERKTAGGVPPDY
jgi:hypothetical protein